MVLQAVYGEGDHIQIFHKNIQIFKKVQRLSKGPRRDDDVNRVEQTTSVGERKVLYEVGGYQ